MAFSFFTKRNVFASRRLRFVARTLQVFGVLTLLGTVYMVWKLPGILQDRWPNAPEMQTRLLRSYFIRNLGSSVSLFVIGRALRRREKWGGYLAIATLGIPIAFTALNPTITPLTFLLSHGVPLLGLGLIATVWNELGSVRDAEIIDHGKPTEPPEPLTPRNRGYGEGRAAQQDRALNAAYLEAARLDARNSEAEKVPVAVAAREPGDKS